MEIHKHDNPRFMVNFPRNEPVLIDSTALTTFMTCPRKYFYRIVLGFTPKETPPYFSFGAAYHKFREILTRSSQDIVDGKQRSAGEAFLIALEAALTYAKKHHKDPKVGTSFDFLTTERLKLSCIKAYEVWLKERKLGQIIVLEAEQPFVLQLSDGRWITGRCDELISWSGSLWARDFKTSSKTGPWYERGLEPNDQFTRYTYATSKLSGRRVKGMVVEVLYNTKKEGPKFEVYMTGRTPGQLEVWEREHSWWADVIDKSRKEDCWPMNPKSCTMCEFHNVCKTTTESAQMSKLRADFKVDPWDASKAGE